MNEHGQKSVRVWPTPFHPGSEIGQVFHLYTKRAVVGLYRDYTPPQAKYLLRADANTHLRCIDESFRFAIFREIFEIIGTPRPDPATIENTKILKNFAFEGAVEGKGRVKDYFILSDEVCPEYLCSIPPKVTKLYKNSNTLNHILESLSLTQKSFAPPVDLPETQDLESMVKVEPYESLRNQPNPAASVLDFHLHVDCLGGQNIYLSDESGTLFEITFENTVPYQIIAKPAYPACFLVVRAAQTADKPCSVWNVWGSDFYNTANENGLLYLSAGEERRRRTLLIETKTHFLEFADPGDQEIKIVADKRSTLHHLRRKLAMCAAES